MMSLVLSLALDGAVGVVTGPGPGFDPARPPATLVVPAPTPPDAGFGPVAVPGGVTPPEQARDTARIARKVQEQVPGSRVLSVETRDGAHRVRVLRNGQVRVVVVPQ